MDNHEDVFTENPSPSQIFFVFLIHSLGEIFILVKGETGEGEGFSIIKLSNFQTIVIKNRQMPIMLHWYRSLANDYFSHVHKKPQQSSKTVGKKCQGY